jgi:hypothetical protein
VVSLGVRDGLHPVDEIAPQDLRDKTGADALNSMRSGSTLTERRRARWLDRHDFNVPALLT